MVHHHDLVSFSLIDFIVDNKTNDDDSSSSPSSSSHNNQVLIEWLKKTLRKPIYQPFSCQFKVSEILDVKSHDGGFFVDISYRYNCLIVHTSAAIHIFSRSTKQEMNCFKFENAVVHAMDEDCNEIFITAGTHDQYYTMKFNLDMFIRSNEKEAEGVIWKCELPKGINPYSSTVLPIFSRQKKYVMVLDNSLTDLILIDSQNGIIEKDFKFALDSNSTLISYRSLQNEIVVAGAEKLQIYKIDCSVNPVALTLKIEKDIGGFFYSMTFDLFNDYIITDTNDDVISVLRRSDLQIVEQYKENDRKGIYGMVLDRLTGELYVCFDEGDIIIYT